MSDTREIIALYDHARRHELAVVLATVVRTSGSTYRKAGARMMLCADGSRVGVVSGGCLEGDVTRRAWFLRTPGQAEVVRYDTGNGEDATYEFGLGCRGVVDVLIERLDVHEEPAIVTAMRRALEERVASTFRTQLSGPDVGRRVPEDPMNPPDDAAVGDCFVERVAPPNQLLIFGSGVDVLPVARIADHLGWRTVVIDHKLRADVLADASARVIRAPGQWQGEVRIDPWTVAVVMSHRMDDDARYLGDLLSGSVVPRAIACLGPASRTEALFDTLALAGVVPDVAARARVQAPAGLDIGAESPEEIALSILAGLQAALTSAAGGLLAERAGPIHADATSVAR